MDDALTVSRSQSEESQAARMIYSTTGLFRHFIKYVSAAGLQQRVYSGNKTVLTRIDNNLCFIVFVFQWTGLPEWEEQSSRSSVSPSGRSHPLPSGSHLLLPPTGGGAGARGETDQTALAAQPAEPLPGGGKITLSLFLFFYPKA